ncbi:MAG: glycosyltransferase family 4 protein [Candidatus Bathyarchaeota archaeon]|nr:glycosyltransferase family 4 protein [Candidatus Bathyarchaeota archaeon]
MRVAFFVWEYPPAIVGGLGTYAEYITKEFVALGWDVCVYTLNPGDLKTREILGGVQVHRPLLVEASNVLPLFVSDDLKRWGKNVKFFNDVLVYNTLAAAKMINDVIKKEDYEYAVVSVNDWLSSIAGIVCKNELKIPVIFHVHSTEWGRSGGKGSETVNHLESVMAEKADGIITVSHAMKEDLTRHGWSESKIHVVWNGVDPERYDPQKCRSEDIEKLRQRHGIAKHEAMILFLGRLTWVKGVRNLVQAMPLILAEYPKAKLVILGKGEEQRDITELAERLGIAKNVDYHFEFVPEEERILHYAASDLCVFPSTYEPFGIVSLEAMSMEKPIVVGAKGVVGFREQVEPAGPEQNGVHVDSSNPVDIAWGIKEVLKDPSRAKQWGINGRKRVLKMFTWKNVAQQTLAVYSSYINKKSS